jgi:hypothetical protein
VKFTIKSFRTLTVASLGFLLGLSSLESSFAAINLGSAGPSNWTALEIGNGSVTVDTFNVAGTSAIWGNTGVSSPDHLAMSGGSLIYGNLYLGNTATTSFSGGSGVAPGYSTFTNQDTLLNAATNDALAAAAFYGSQPGTSLGAVTTSMTLSPGVYYLTSLVLGGSSTLTLNGSGDFVFNISGALNLQGSSQVILTGGADPANVLFNITGTTLAQTGGGAILRGIILAPNADVTVDSGVGTKPHPGVFGEVISGRNITIASGSGIQGVPEPSVLALMIGMGGLGVLGAVGRAIFRRCRS